MKKKRKTGYFIVGILLIFFAWSCDNDDDDDRGLTDESYDCDPHKEDACELIDDSHCLDEYDFEFISARECKRELIPSYLNSNDRCERAVGACLDTMEKYGPDPECPCDGCPCVRLQPVSCDQAWQLWNECLALANQEEC